MPEKNLLTALTLCSPARWMSLQEDQFLAVCALLSTPGSARALMQSCQGLTPLGRAVVADRWTIVRAVLSHARYSSLAALRLSLSTQLTCSRSCRTSIMHVDHPVQ